jgi:hypothetical protein
MHFAFISEEYIHIRIDYANSVETDLWQAQ